MIRKQVLWLQTLLQVMGISNRFSVLHILMYKMRGGDFCLLSCVLNSVRIFDTLAIPVFPIMFIYLVLVSFSFLSASS